MKSDLKLPVLWGLALIAAFAATPVRAQLSSGTILGTVMDSSGAVISGASIRISNSAIGLIREIVTNPSGNFRVDQLPVGTYTVEAEMSGFRKEVRSGLRLDIDQRARVDFTLTPGQISEQVNVSAEAPLVQTEDSSIGQIVEERKIVTLPLNGRNFSQLAYIAPGAFAPRPTSSLGNRGGFAVAGLHESMNQFLLDGINNNGTGTMEISARINIDAVGEFKVVTGTYPAQYGRYAGAQVDIVTKSGTNEVHGSAFAFTRNDDMDTRNVFDPYPLPGGNLPEFRRHQFGGTVGGPIKKDKVFFFAGFQGQRQARFTTTRPSVPLPVFFTGNLSAMPQVAKDPRTGQPFEGNIIPSNRISPIALKFQQFWPLPTGPGLVSNATALLSTPDNFSQPVGKIDWNISKAHSLRTAYNFFNDKFMEVFGSDLPNFLSDSLVRSQSLSISEQWLISPTKINEFRAGWSRLNRSRLSPNRYKNWNAEFGIPGTAADFDAAAWGVPLVLVTGFSTLGDGNTIPQPRVEQTFTVADNFTLIHGNHAFKFGADMFKQQLNSILFLTGRGSFTFNGSVTGNPFADFLLGLPAVTQRQPLLGPVKYYPRRPSVDWYVQDDWRLLRNFTLNFGVRYEYMGGITEINGKIANFDPTLGPGGGILVGTGQFWDNAVQFYQQLYPSLVMKRTSDSLYRSDKNNFAPRLGFAYSPFPKKNTVIRAGYGVFFQIQELGFNEFYSNPPLSIFQRFTNAAGIPWDNPWGSLTAAPITITSIDRNMATPYVQQWTLDLQHELPGGIVVDAAYVGKKGTKLRQERDMNQPLDRSSAQAVTKSRPYPLFGQIARQENVGNSIYHGLQWRAEKRTGNGMSFLLSYAFGKMIDDTAIASTSATGASGLPMDSYNLHLQRALSTDDVRHRFSLSYIMPLPFGPGRKFMDNAHGVSRALVADWELSGIFRANSGSPFNPVISQDISRTGNLQDRPILVGNPNLDNPIPQRWWDSTAFKLPAAGTFGNAGRNILIGPGYWGWDFSIQKNFKMRERQQLQFRLDFFNVLNHPNYNTPVATANAGNFGAITSAQDSRQIQLGLRYAF